MFPNDLVVCHLDLLADPPAISEKPVTVTHILGRGNMYQDSSSTSSECSPT